MAQLRSVVRWSGAIRTNVSLSRSCIAPLTNWRTHCLVLALLVCFAVGAWADLVSGRVFDPNGNALKNTAFDVFKGDAVANRFTTDASGNFTVYLDSGRYTVRPQNDKTLEGTLESYAQPARQDIRLHRR